jgi:hypothetical protein
MLYGILYITHLWRNGSFSLSQNHAFKKLTGYGQFCSIPETCTRCLESGFFPKQGESCLDFGKPCEHTTVRVTCQTDALLASDAVLQERVEKELAEESICLNFTLEEIIDKPT